MAFKQPISQAPRDGTLVEVMTDDAGPYRMRWDAKATNGLFPGVVGMWVSEGDTFTWDESNGCGPTWFRKIMVH